VLNVFTYNYLYLLLCELSETTRTYYELSRSLERLKKAKSVETLRRAPPVRVGELGNVKKV